MAKKSALIFGIIFVLAGILGFFMNPVIGLIAANTASNIIHIIIGIILLVVAGKSSAAMALKTVGIIYVIWAILSFLGVNVGPASTATAWFYLVVGIIIAALGFASKKGMSSAPAAPMTPQM
jgi:hypothetical protein